MISIGLPAFKSKYLKTAIESVLNQSYNDYELIIVNDASPEAIKEIVNSFDDPRIKYYENERNLGKESIVKNWNKCLEYSQGEYFVLFSDDDIYEKDFLAELYDLIKKYPKVNIAHCRIKIINENGQTIDYSSSCPEFENVIDFIWHRLKLFRTHYAPEFIIKTSKLKEIGGFIDFPLAWSSDDATWFELAKENGIVFLNKPLCSWRSSSINLSKTGSAELRIKANILFNEWMNDFITKIKTTDEADEFKIGQLKSLMQNWKKLNVSNILMITSGSGYLSLIKIFSDWLKFRKKYSLGVLILIRTISLRIKHLFFGKFK